MAVDLTMLTVIPGSSQSNRDRAELAALRPLGRFEDCAKVVEFLATDLSDYVTGAVIPIDGGLVCDRAVSASLSPLSHNVRGVFRQTFPSTI